MLVPNSETYGNVFQGFRRERDERVIEPRASNTNYTQNYQR